MTAPAPVDVIVVGGGHSGLAASHALAQRGIDHLVFERGEIGEAWRTQRWDSLRLLTPNWMTQLPGHGYQGGNPHGFMRAAEVANFLAGYAKAMATPLLTATVLRAAPAHGGWLVQTDRGDWVCRALVMATGGFSRPVVPAVAANVPPGIAQLTAHSYRNPGQLDPGGVLVVGASASGLQLAQEIRRSGRAVTLAVGEHVRMPRTYRGKDVQWWMCATGMLDERIEDMDDPQRARHLPSPQLAGTPERATLDLNALREEGVAMAGRLMGIRDGKALFSGSLRNVCALADLKMNRLLDRFDEWAVTQERAAQGEPPQRFAPTVVDAAPVLSMDLAHQVSTIVWATGMKPDHRWLDAPVFDRHGDVRHQGGVVDGVQGLYVMGLPFMRRRKSSFIHGAGDDARELVAHLHAALA